jgi:hypothetical protein
MELKTYFAQDASGNIMPGATVMVYEAATTTLATGLQDESGSPLANPFTADSSAKVAFYAPDGLYDITVVGNGRTVTIRAQFVSVDGAIVLRSDLAAPGGSALVGADDGASGSLWTTVAGFIAFLLSSLGASVIGFIQAGVGSVARSIQSKLRDSVSVADFMTPEQIADVTAGTLTIDVTSAVQAALNTGKSLDFIEGNFLVGPLSVPAAAAGATYRGKGFWHYGKTKKTRFTARDAGQTHIFSLANGADNISFELMRLDGENKAVKCIDATYGAFLSLDAVGVYGATEWGIFSKQGLARWRRLYVRCENATGGGALLGSDGSVESSEFTRGAVPLRIAAGGSRLSNVWANGGSECCLELSPFDSGTNHMNTCISNLYAGETLGGATLKPIIKIAGLSSRRVEDVHFTNSHFVAAETATNKINRVFDISYARDVVISSSSAFGFSSPTADRYLESFVRAENTLNLTVNGNVVRYCMKNPIVIGANCYPANITNNTISEYCTDIASGSEGAAILIDNNTSYGAITGNILDISGSSAVPYAVEGGNPARWVFDGNLARFANATIWNPATGVFAGGYQRMGGQPVPRGQISGSATYDAPSIAAGATTTTTVTVAGAALGDMVLGVSLSVDAGGLVVSGYVSAANTVTVRLSNPTASAIDIASASLRVRVLKVV